MNAPHRCIKTLRLWNVWRTRKPYISDADFMCTRAVIPSSLIVFSRFGARTRMCLELVDSLARAYFLPPWLFSLKWDWYHRRNVENEGARILRGSFLDVLICEDPFSSVWREDPLWWSCCSFPVPFCYVRLFRIFYKKPWFHLANKNWPLLLIIYQNKNWSLLLFIG